MMMLCCFGCGGGKDGGNKTSSLPEEDTTRLSSSDSINGAVDNVSENAGVVWTALKDSPFYSADGRRWDISAMSIAWGKDKFVAGGGKWIEGGGGGAFIESANLVSKNVAYSLDGITWTVIKNSFFDNYGIDQCIVWAKDRFIASSTIGGMVYSSDGITWASTAINPLRGIAVPSSVVWGNNIFVAGGSYCDEEGCRRGIAYSSDGINWDTVKDPPLGVNIISANTSNGNKFFAYGDGRIAAYSLDGIIWTNVESRPFGESMISAIVWGGNKFVACGYGVSGSRSRTVNGKIAYSLDGITWTVVENHPFGKGVISAIVWGGNKFVASGYDIVSDNALCKIAYSSDGITWTIVKDYPFDKRPTKALAYGNGTFVAVSDDGKLAYSK
jgi:hypothetical protein